MGFKHIMLKGLNNDDHQSEDLESGISSWKGNLFFGYTSWKGSMAQFPCVGENHIPLQIVTFWELRHLITFQMVYIKVFVFNVLW